MGFNSGFKGLNLRNVNLRAFNPVVFLSVKSYVTQPYIQYK